MADACMAASIGKECMQVIARARDDSLDSANYSSNFADDQGHFADMLHLSPTACLFCQHRNPPGAEYCESCDGQLNLQPCPHCDAVDLRTASHCYKCGAPFPAGARSVPAPVAALVAPTAVQRLPVDPLPPAEPAARPRSGAALAVALIGCLLAGAAAAAYVYRAELPRLAQSLGLAMPAFARPGSGGGDGGSLQDGAARVGPPIPMVTDTAQALPPAVDTSVRTPVPPAARADAQPGEDPSTQARDSTAPGGCPPAVAALGLCNPVTPQEKP